MPPLATWYISKSVVNVLLNLSRNNYRWTEFKGNTNSLLFFEQDWFVCVVVVNASMIALKSSTFNTYVLCVRS